MQKGQLGVGYKDCPHINAGKANVTYVPALEIIKYLRLSLLFQDTEQRERLVLVGFIVSSFPEVYTHVQVVRNAVSCKAVPKRLTVF